MRASWQRSNPSPWIPCNGVEAELKHQRPLERAPIPKGDMSPCRRWRKNLHPSQARWLDQAIKHEHGKGTSAPGWYRRAVFSSLHLASESFYEVRAGSWAGSEQFAVTFIFSSSAEVFGKLLKYLSQAGGQSPIAEDSWGQLGLTLRSGSQFLSYQSLSNELLLLGAGTGAWERRLCPAGPVPSRRHESKAQALAGREGVSNCHFSSSVNSFDL